VWQFSETGLSSRPALGSKSSRERIGQGPIGKLKTLGQYVFGKLFHLLTTLLEKKYFQISFEQLRLGIFTEWHLVRPVVSRTNNYSN